MPRECITPALYTDRWCYAPVGADGQAELYDLDDDPYAETNVAGQNGRIVRQLHGQFVAWLRDVDAPAGVVALFE